MDLAGRSLGKFEVLGELGWGGMAVVYKGYHPTLQRHVAIKVLAPHRARNPDLVQRFLREARAVARLSHPNIVHVYDVGQEQDLYYFIMEYVPGRALSKMLAERRLLPQDEILAIAGQVAAALDYAHEQGLIHRDVKPSNIMVEPKGRAVLTDFGIAWAAEEDRLTVEGGALGTPQYMAPEQVQAQDVGPRTDLYALGVVIYELLAGVVPFDAPSTTAVMHQQVYNPVPPIRTKNPDVPATVEAVLQRALAKLPAERYGSGADLIDAVSRALQGEVVEEPRPEPETTPTLLFAQKPALSSTESPEVPQTAAAARSPLAQAWRRLHLPSWAWAGAAAALVVVAFLLVRGLTAPAPPTAPATVTATEATVEPSSAPPTTPALRQIGSLSLADVGQAVFVEGEIGEFDAFSSGVRFKLDDGTGQIVLLLWQPLFEEVPYGEGLDDGARVRVQGNVEQYQGTLEIIPQISSDLVILVAARSPEASTVAALGSADVGRSVRLEGTLAGETPFSQGVRYLLDDGTGQIVLVLWDRVAEYAPAGLGPGTHVWLTGQIDEYEGTLEIVPRRGRDVEIIP